MERKHQIKIEILVEAYATSGADYEVNLLEALGAAREGLEKEAFDVVEIEATAVQG